MIEVLILHNNEKQKIDKARETFIQMGRKLEEEYKELKFALMNMDNERIIEETLDVAQVLVGIVDKLSETKTWTGSKADGVNMDITAKIAAHNKKLIDRGWSVKKTIRIALTEKL